MQASSLAPRVHVKDAPDTTLLAVYLRDHLAAAVAGVRVARRALQHSRGTGYEAELREVVREIHEDRRVLMTAAEHLGVPASPAKQALAALAEVAGSAKLNGQLVGTSPLTRLVELEGLLLGVRGKLQLWRALDAAFGPDRLPPELDAAEMARRASEQLERLSDAHAQAARLAFGEAA